MWSKNGVSAGARMYWHLIARTSAQVWCSAIRNLQVSSLGCVEIHDRDKSQVRWLTRDECGLAWGLPCVLQTVGMPIRLHHIVIDTHDLPGLARFWTQALGWKILSEREREIVIGTDENAPVGICFMPVTDPKTVKNRVHLDLTSGAADRLQEIDRLLALGARRVDIGQTGTESWTVLADPEGNEFCVVRPKETLIR
jgi:predicted enzyme related to lactoylglutathione lyase